MNPPRDRRARRDRVAEGALLGRASRRLCGVPRALGRAGAAQRSATQDDARARALGQGLSRDEATAVIWR